MSVYYNEFDPQAAAWIRELIKAGLIPAGDVDERSIEDVTPNELRGYTQCHFFAGIAGWAYALDLAGWPRDRPVWTGSCPCQPFSAAGARNGFDDQRHLWPAFYHIIRECRPAVVFGEQVASSDGRKWLSRVCADVEAVGYAIGAADLCAAGAGSPQIRQRLYWVADANGSDQNQWAPGRKQPFHNENHGNTQGLGHAESEQMGAVRQPWELSEAIECEDGWRRIEPGAQPLVDGLPGRLDRIRGFGNAIVPQVGAQFVRAYLESRASVAVAA